MAKSTLCVSCDIDIKLAIERDDFNIRGQVSRICNEALRKFLILNSSIDLKELEKKMYEEKIIELDNTINTANNEQKRKDDFFNSNVFKKDILNRLKSNPERLVPMCELLRNKYNISTTPEELKNKCETTVVD